SWKSDHATATQSSIWPTAPPGCLPPVSASATSCSRPSRSTSAGCFFASLMTPPVADVAGESPNSPVCRQARRLLQPALLLEVSFSTRMQRRRISVRNHLLRIEIGEGRMQRLELVEIFEHRPGQLVDALF